MHDRASGGRMRRFTFETSRRCSVPHAEVNGQRLYYEEHGSGEPLLLIMGLAADQLSWALQIPVWSTHFRTIAFDNRDVGQSSYADGPYELTDMADDTLALADALELDSFHLVGVSMGGAIAQHVALAAPDRIRTLTLCVTWGGSGPWAAHMSRTWSTYARRQSREERIDELMLRCFSERFYENAEQVEFVRNMMLQNPHFQELDGFVRQLDASSRHETRDRVRSLSMPVHVIGAEYDVLVPIWKSRELAELIPDARLTVLDGAAHGVQLEQAEQFNAAVLDFLVAHREAAAPA
jgi:pimeloyl-ACP methyl ester carboxylesterase